MSFIDTNVLVYATAAGSPFHARARAALNRISWSGPVAISRQVLREYLAVMTRSQTSATALTLREAIADTQMFCSRFVILEDGPAVWDQRLALGQRFTFGGRQVHDANIVATMLTRGETHLLTFNGVDFRRLQNLIAVVVP